MKVNIAFEGIIENTTSANTSQMGTNNLWDLFWERIILLQDVELYVNIINNDSKRHPIIWHFL
jgi:hypothetical protein